MADRDGRAVRPSPLIRVAVHSDDQLFSEGMLRILDGVSLYTIVDYRAVDENRPHVILLDSRMDSALSLCESIASAGSAPSVILFAAPEEPQFAARALATGARGILPKSTRVEDLVCAIEDVRGGLFWARPEVLAARIDFLSNSRETT